MEHRHIEQVTELRNGIQGQVFEPALDPGDVVRGHLGCLSQLGLGQPFGSPKFSNSATKILPYLFEPAASHAPTVAPHPRRLN